MRDQLDRWLQRNPMPERFPSGDAKAEFFNSMPQSAKREWDLRQAREQCQAPDYMAATAERAAKRMARVDDMPRELRAVVYEYGLEIVQEFVNHGVTTPNRIKYLVDVVRNAELPTGQRRFKVNKGVSAKRNPIEYEDDDGEYYVVTGR